MHTSGPSRVGDAVLLARATNGTLCRVSAPGNWGASLVSRDASLSTILSGCIVPVSVCDVTSRPRAASLAIIIDNGRNVPPKVNLPGRWSTATTCCMYPALTMLTFNHERAIRQLPCGSLSAGPVTMACQAATDTVGLPGAVTASKAPVTPSSRCSAYMEIHSKAPFTSDVMPWMQLSCALWAAATPSAQLLLLCSASSTAQQSPTLRQ